MSVFNKKEFSIGLAMIARNSEATIANAIKSVNKICQQILIVDTGSSDSTTSIASNLSAELQFRFWENDFSLARNFALNFMRTEWIIVLDTDEELELDSFLSSIHLLKDEKIGGIKVKIKNYLNNNDKEVFTIHSYTRIFRNHPQIRFRGKIHEQINESILDAGFEIADSNVSILHFGYINTNDKKIERNKEMLENEIAENPQEDWLKYHLAETEFAGANFDNAEKLFSEIVNSILLSVEQKEKAKLRLAQISLKKDDYTSAIQWTEFISNSIDIEGFRKYVKGTAFLMQNNFIEAKLLLQSHEANSSSMIDKKHIKEALELIDSIIAK